LNHHPLHRSSVRSRPQSFPRHPVLPTHSGHRRGRCGPSVRGLRGFRLRRSPGSRFRPRPPSAIRWRTSWIEV